MPARRDDKSGSDVVDERLMSRFSTSALFASSVAVYRQRCREMINDMPTGYPLYAHASKIARVLAMRVAKKSGRASARHDE